MKKLLLLTIFISSCAILQPNKTLDSHLSKSSYSLILSYGQPNRKTSDGNSGEIWVYAENIYNPPTTIYTTGGPVTTPSKNYWKYKMFYINKSGNVYHWLVKYMDIPPQRIDMTIYENIRIN